MWICDNCGHNNSGNICICSKCGVQFAAREQGNPGAEPSLKSQQRNKFSPAVPVLLSIILILAVGIVWLLNKGILVINIQGQVEEINSNSQVEVPSSVQIEESEEAFLLAQAVAQEYGNKRFLAAGSHFTIGILSDGSCIATGKDFPDISSWTDMKSLSAFNFIVVGLRNDGTVLCSDGSINVHDWRNVIQIDFFSEVFGNDRHVVGLLSDGTVVSTGTNNYGEGDVSNWSGIIDIAAGSTHTVALQADGTVVACGNNEYGQCNVSEWSRIVDVDASRYVTYGLTAEGEILVTGFYEDKNKNSNVPEVPQWDNVVAIIASNETGNADDFVVGICSDGTIVSNRTGYLRVDEIGSFSDVQAVAVASWGYTICSDSQGNVREVGWDVGGARCTQDWPLLLTS